MSDETRLRPRAFRLEPGEGVAPVALETRPDPFAPPDDPDEAATEAAQRAGFWPNTGLSWGRVLLSALGALASLAFGLWLDGLVEGLFARSPALGVFGLGLIGLAVLAACVLVARELIAISGQRAIARLHAALALAHTEDDRDAARKKVAELEKLYAHRPETAAARKHLAELRGEIVDGADLIDIAERTLMPPLDSAARREIAAAAKRVSLVAALAPRAIIDVVFVAAQALRLIRRIAEIYGGKPGLLGAWRLARAVGAHLALTGGMALGDGLLQQMLGHGVAAKISARLGEGVFNGMLTARIGLAAMAVCRPMPFTALKPPGVGDVAPFLFGEGKGG